MSPIYDVMSGEPDNNQDGAEDQPAESQQSGGQSQAGGQQVGQQQGGQPNAGQSQGPSPGGQVAAGQGGQQQQPPVGAARSNRQQQANSIPPLVQEWVVYVTAIFGIAAFGFGLNWLIIDAIEEPIFEASSSTGFGSGFSAGMVQISALIAFLSILAVAAVLTGIYLGRNLDVTDQMAYKVAGGSLAAGAAVFMLLSMLLLSFTLDNISVAFGGLIINTIITAIFVAAVAVGGVWVSRNRQPSEA